jgi:hypothetical protein
MKKTLFFLFLLSWASLYAQGKPEKDPVIHHSIQVDLDVDHSKIRVENQIDLSTLSESDGNALHFYLNRNLFIDSCNYKIEEVKQKEDGDWKEYQIIGKVESTQDEFLVRYHGIIADEKESLMAPPRRGGGKETSGIVFEKGIYLSGSTAWLPRFKNASLMTFDMTATIDSAWNVLAQGEELRNELLESKRIIQYESLHPTHQIYLLGNKWTDYSQKSGKLLLQAFLIHPDKELAEKYLAATARYLQMYEKMIGEYPYSKFALVENFWETGYGMPSFTLLGQRVIRMPWIIASSYPHEFLHNYWGNSVFVDYSKGNWSEGTTTYMADHLFKEMKGQGAEYRQTALQKFSNYVNAENDFPLTEFKSRTTQASSAIGYDKFVMVNHMLRMKYGKENYLKAYADFYKNNQFREVSFEEIRESFEKITGDDLSGFFQQWIQRTGAPAIVVEHVKQEQKQGKYLLSFRIRQSQEEEVFSFDLPLSIFQKDSAAIQQRLVTVDQKSQDFSLTFDTEVERMEVDPEFDVMRRLDSREVSVTLSALLGTAKSMLILPSNSSSLEDYQVFAKSFQMSQQRQGKQVEIVMDSELSDFPSEEFVWVLGEKNLFVEKVGLSQDLQSNLDAESLQGIENVEGSIFYIQSVKHQNVAFMAAKDSRQLSSILMKLGHYGSYSYLLFDAAENKNTLKGVFPIFESPMIFNLTPLFDRSSYKAKKTRESLLSEMQ